MLFPTARQVAHALLTRPPLRHSIHSTVEAQRFFILSNFLASHLHHSVNRVSPFDLHVLGAPPAFVLSQDQTLEKLYLNTFVLKPKSFKLKSSLFLKKIISSVSFDTLELQGSLFLSMLFNFQGPVPSCDSLIIISQPIGLVKHFFQVF